MKNLEVEGGEVAIKNKNGDVAIIPKNKVAYVQSLIKAGQHSKVDAFVSMLPKMASKANDGTVVENGTEPKKKTHEELQRLYGKGVKNREIYLDLYDKPLDETKTVAYKSIFEENTGLSPEALEYQRKYREADYNQKAWEQHLDKYMTGAPFKEDLFMGNKQVYEQAQRFKDIPLEDREMLQSKNAWLTSGMSEEDAQLRGDYYDYMMNSLGDFNKQRSDARYSFENDPSTKIETVNPKTTWRNLIEKRKDVKDKALLYASLMDEGGDQFTYNYQGGERDAYSGFGSFGLDTFGQRFDEFVKKGYIGKEMRNRIVMSSAINEKQETVKSADFTNLDDVITAKEAFLNASRDSISRKAKELGLNLSPTAMDYFTVASYNMGEAGAREMLQAYNKAGILKDDAFMKDDSYNYYREPHRNAKRRVQAMNMIRGEKLIK